MKTLVLSEISPLRFQVVDLFLISVLLSLTETFAVSGRDVMFSLVTVF